MARSTAAGNCRHIKADRSPCRAMARSGSDYCFFHDPDSAAERQAARINGGKERSRKSRVLPPDTPDAQLTTAADVKGLLNKTINQVLRGEVDPRISNAVGYLAGILLKAKQQDEFEDRLERLESVLASQKVNPRAADGESFEFVNPLSGGQA